MQIFHPSVNTISKATIFGGLFLAYTVYRQQNEMVFAAASQKLDLTWGTINTIVLLCSSLTMALSVEAARLQQRPRLVCCLAATIVLGAMFLGIKGMEYHEEYQRRLMPVAGLPFVWEESSPRQAELFFHLYFLMTGGHALHMIIGLGMLSVLLMVSVRGGL